MSFALPEFTTTLIEAAAFVLALGYVLLSIRQVIWGWPLMIVSSVLYGVLFATSRLYGQAALQGVFVAIGLWGWWQWRRGRKGDAPLQVTPLATRARWLLVLGWAALSLFSALALARLTDAAAPWLDAFTTLGSLVGQVLTARKYVEAWPVWIVVNLVSVALFLQQQLWLTALLYGLFVGLSVIGWQQWRRAARVSSG
jgi:nicotinamide mononucleotide transporter